MWIDIKSRQFWIALAAGAAAALAIALLRGLGGGRTLGENAASLSDGLFVAGALMAGVGVLQAISGKTDFFDMLEQKGCKGKEEADCRQYAFNWINYNHKNKNHGKESKCYGKAGSAEISANRPEDYNGVC